MRANPGVQPTATAPHAATGAPLENAIVNETVIVIEIWIENATGTVTEIETEIGIATERETDGHRPPPATATCPTARPRAAHDHAAWAASNAKTGRATTTDPGVGAAVGVALVPSDLAVVLSGLVVIPPGDPLRVVQARDAAPSDLLPRDGMIETDSTGPGRPVVISTITGSHASNSKIN